MLAVCCASPTSLAAQQPPTAGSSTGVIGGEVTAQGGTITLGGVQILVFIGLTRVGNVNTEGDGAFKIENLASGTYRQRSSTGSSR